MFKRAAIILLFAALTALTASIPQGIEDFGQFSKFQEWSKSNNKTFISMHHMNKTFNCWKKNIDKVEELNKINQKESEDEAATFGVTAFSDLTEEDFAKTYLNLNIEKLEEDFTQFNLTDLSNLTDNSNSDSNNGRNLQGARKLQVYSSWDWRSKGAVGTVKSQGKCGSCYAFATTGLFEGLYAIKYGTLYNFSEQQILDCDPYDSGCSGGSAMNAISYIRYSGLTTTGNYGTYKGYRQVCSHNINEAIAYTTGYVTPGTDETSIANYIANYGPVAAAINAKPLQYYTGGIINLGSAYCNPYVLDHAVLIVGFGISNNTPYWIVKNSWGPYWGENGYFRVARGYGGVCGINRLVYSAILS